jgi:alkanesulfonate monooxygenase SsuD/methylene tetrahydromethanopterin reductase-like flavin-dependent oxidoreductase (luciferase family)
MPDGFERSVGLVGTREEIGALLEAYRDAGLDTVCVVPVSTSDDAGRRALEVVADLNASTADAG